MGSYDYEDKKRQLEKIKEEYRLAVAGFAEEEQDNAEIYLKSKELDDRLIESFGYCAESEILEEELNEFRKQRERELENMEAQISELRRKIEIEESEISML